MVEKRLLAVFIVLGLAVVLGTSSNYMCIVLFLAFVRYNRTITRRSSIGRLRLCRGDRHSKIWQTIHWLI